MEGTAASSVSRKPSRLRAPQIKVSNHHTATVNNINQNAVKTKLRRSKSVTDLAKNVDGIKFADLVKPLGIRLPQKGLTRVEPNGIQSSGLTKLRRRSKSVTDLHLINKCKVAITPHVKTATKHSSSDTKVLKRKAVTSQVEVKNKIVKVAKIPSWDYKSRYNKLLEDFNRVSEELQIALKKEKEYDTVRKQLEGVQKERNDFENQCAVLIRTNSTLEKENKELFKIQKSYVDLKNKHELLLNDFASLKQLHAQKVEECQELSSNLKCNMEKNLYLNQQCNLLKQDLIEGQLLRRALNNTIQDLKGNIRVFCRVRPILEDTRLPCLINVTSEKTIEIRKSRESISSISGKCNDMKTEFTLDKVFDSNSAQEDIFEDLSQLVQSALDGYNVCVLAYGQTGSGKTYTMQGVEGSNQAGLIPRTIDLIFSSINDLKRGDWIYDVRASFLEIYNESVRDLLNPNTSQNLEIRYNEGKGTTVTNLSIQKLNSVEELKKFMNIAQSNRAVAATNFNQHSSRSHAVTKIYLQGKNETTNLSYTGSINLVDLAGSETAKTSSNDRIMETKNINKSLSTLGTVMLALYNKEKHIPYRNSKLTYLLQSSLGGNSKTLMIVNIAPFEDCFTESINSLRFAAKVKEVKMDIKRNIGQ